MQYMPRGRAEGRLIDLHKPECTRVFVVRDAQGHSMFLAVGKDLRKSAAYITVTLDIEKDTAVAADYRPTGEVQPVFGAVFDFNVNDDFHFMRWLLEYDRFNRHCVRRELLLLVCRSCWFARPALSIAATD
jgi:hypothetical protein